MLKFTPQALGTLKSSRLENHNDRLSKWLSTRDAGWDDIALADQKEFLSKNNERALAHGIGSEQSRGMLALSYLMSGDPDRFNLRGDVRAILSHATADEYAKVRRLYAIAFGLKNNKGAPVAKDDAIFEMESLHD